MAPVDVLSVSAPVRQRLLSARNADGGWPYAPGKRSRIEPTCWALLALASRAESTGASRVFGNWPRNGARFVDGPQLPPNNGHNALAALVLLRDGPAGETLSRTVADALVSSKALKIAQSDIVIQDNTLQAWGWVDDTAGWVEPTAWCVLLLKHLQRQSADAARNARIDVGDRMLLDRACRDGGWNYGNSIVYGKELWPYAATTALALLALQNRRDQPIVRQALYRLAEDASREGSLAALGLAALCLRVYDGPAAALQEQLAAAMSEDAAAQRSGDDVMGMAMSLCALGDTSALAAFKVA